MRSEDIVLCSSDIISLQHAGNECAGAIAVRFAECAVKVAVERLAPGWMALPRGVAQVRCISVVAVIQSRI